MKRLNGCSIAMSVPGKLPMWMDWLPCSNGTQSSPCHHLHHGIEVATPSPNSPLRLSSARLACSRVRPETAGDYSPRAQTELLPLQFISAPKDRAINPLAFKYWNLAEARSGELRISLIHHYQPAL